MRLLALAALLALLIGCNNQPTTPQASTASPQPDVAQASSAPAPVAAPAANLPRIDATTDETMQASIKEVIGALPEEQVKEFQESLMILMMSNINLFALGNPATKAATEATMKANIHGLTGPEVIARAAQRREEIRQAEAERKRQAEAEARQEVTALRKKQAQAVQALKDMKAFAITSAKYHKRPSSFGPPEPIIELEVTNGTAYPVSRAHFNGTLATPGRSVPWLSDDFNYKIAGGLEPGETASWSLAPNMFGEWGSVDAPADAVLTVTVVRLDGPDGNPIFDGEAFTERDARRLKELLAEFPSLK